MKRLLIILLFSVPAIAAPKPEPLPPSFYNVRLVPQIVVGVGTAQRLQRVSSDLAVCAPGDVEFNTGSGLGKICLTANTWTALNTGSSTVSLSSVTDPSANKSFTMGTNTLNFNFTGNWGSGFGYSITSNGSNASTGPLFQLSTGASTTHDVAQFCAQGTTSCVKVDSSAILSAPLYATSTNCSDSAGAAACGSAAAGAVVVDAGSTTVVVSTTAVTANSEIFVEDAPYLSTRLSVTCNATVALPTVTAITAATSFTITVAAAPVTNPACYVYHIVN